VGKVIRSTAAIIESCAAIKRWKSIDCACRTDADGRISVLAPMINPCEGFRTPRDRSSHRHIRLFRPTYPVEFAGLESYA
jgi:hypothetical protein